MSTAPTPGLLKNITLCAPIDSDVERQRICNVLGKLAGSAPKDASIDLVRESLRSLAQFYRARFAFLGLLPDDGSRRIDTLAVWAGSEFAENFSYDLAGTPCADVMCFEIELVPSEATRLYPDDALLARMGIDSYFGAPLLDTNGEVFGILSVMHVEPMRLNEWTTPILGTFAARLGAELGRSKAQEALLALNNDLERQVEARTAALARVNRELDEFSAAVSHDLRAPLRAMSGFSRALREDCSHEMSAQAGDYLTRIDDAARRMARLVGDLLKLSKTSRGELNLRELDLVPLLREAEARARVEFPDHAVRFDCPQAVLVRGDSRLLTAALTNLIHNAWKFTQLANGPQVEFGVGEHEARAVYWVRDNGAGFDPRYQDKLFAPFGRLHAEDEYRGTGIGLATTFRVVDRHGGKIWAESEPGQGATFYFTLRT